MSALNKVFALALYDNEAESEDELTFKKNDLLQVLECNYMGMEGWWLCKLVKSNKMGLAAGNRLKMTTDEKLIAQLSQVGKLSSSKLVFGGQSGALKLAHVLSTSSSVSSILSSSSSSLSTTTSGSTVATNISFQEELTKKPDSVQEASPKPTPITLPSKLPLKTCPKLSSLLPSLQPVISEVPSSANDDDDYDYDIPENNRPIAAPAPSVDSPTSTCSLPKLEECSSARKSISPTIDSGVSTSSLASLSLSDTPSPHAHRLSSDSNSTSTSSASSSSLENESPRDAFAHTLERLVHLCTLLDGQHQLTITKSTLLVKKEKLLELAAMLNSFLSQQLKSLKQKNACFHPDLAVFNRFKTLYRQIKEFYFYYQSTLATLDKVYAWNYDLIVEKQQQSPLQSNSSSGNEYFDLLNRIGHLGELMRQLRSIVNEKNLFEYTCETSTAIMATPVAEEPPASCPPIEPEDLYQYDYDNSPANAQTDSVPDMADYCTIDEEDEDSETQKDDVNSATLKKSDTRVNQDTAHGQIRREVRIEDQESSEPTLPAAAPVRLTACDQMLIKFYLKHIEENLTELTTVQHGLVEKLTSISWSQEAKSKAAVLELAHKLAISGHKLVFICDTLQRNINNVSLKQSLFESSNSLCSALKVYMIRLKSTSVPSSNESLKNLIVESIGSVFECAHQFKSIILKYYFKSF